MSQARSTDIHETIPPSPIVDEKHVVDTDIASVIDSFEGDEALQLVGRERTANFSEEYNKRLRRKLVNMSSLMASLLELASRFLGFRDSTTLRSCILHAVLVRDSYISS